MYSVLFLCTGNSARSIMAESLLRHWGGQNFIAYSAGSQPKGLVHHKTLALLQMMNLPTDGLRSKSWDEFSSSSGVRLDFVFTVCSSAAGEICPVWPGQPITAHWGVADPVGQEGTERERNFAFRRALLELEQRIKLFISLPIHSLDRVRLQRSVDEIGRSVRFPE